MDNKHPQAEWFQPDSEKMTDEELESAYKQLVSFPRVVKQKRDPEIIISCPDCKHLSTQKIGAISFMKLPEEKDGIQYFFKLRGTWETPDDFEKHAKKIITDVDSVFPIQAVQMGIWAPVTMETKSTDNEIIIREDVESGKVEDDPIKKAEDKHNSIIKQLREREKILKDPKAADDPTSDPASIEYYTMKKVTIKSIEKYLSEGENKLKELRGKMDEAVKELENLDEKHSDYASTWIDTYNKKRKEVGMTPITEELFETSFGKD